MAHKVKRINFLLEEKLSKELDSLVPHGQRSRVVNEALKKELLKLKREKATEKLMKIRSKGHKVSIEEITEVLKKDRHRHQK